MRLGGVWLVMATGCAFRLPDGAAAGTPTPDGAVPPGEDSAPPPPPVDAPFVTCTTSDPDLAVCLELEDPANLGVDGSGKSHDATLANVTTTQRPVPAPSRAVTVDITSDIAIADSADFNMSGYTLAAWVDPDSAAASGDEAGVLDLGAREAALVIDDQGRVVCYAKTTQTLWFRTGPTVASGQWSFVACTYQEPTLCAYVLHADGSGPEKTCGSTTDGAPMHTSSTFGVKVGNVVDAPSGPTGVRMHGGVDAIRVYRRGLTQTELCASAGLPGC